MDVEFAMRAVETGQPFHVIHFGSAYKFDIFPGGRDRFSRPEMARRRLTSISGAGLGNLEFPVSSPEDTILAKLRQVRQGGEVSDRQWNDILGLLRIQSERLDRDYLMHWAKELGVEDLLRRADHSSRRT